MAKNHMALQRPRLSTGIAGLDSVAGGGLLVGGVYLLAGGPGTGKTVIANQICFNHAREGGRCIYVTLLAESHSRLLTNLASLRFFDPSLLSDQFSYLSAAKNLRNDGPEALLELIEQEVRRRDASLLVLDGLRVGFASSMSTHPEHTAFFNRLAALLEFSNCTALLCALSRPGSIAPEHALADGLLELTQRRVGHCVVRELVATKLRGSLALEGPHSFQIDERGAVVYPRFESLMARSGQVPQSTTGRSPFGIAALDEMLTGGLPAESTTALIGATGSGKTLLGLQFLAEGARRGERSLYFGFHDGPERIIQQGDSIGLNLAHQSKDDALDISWQRPYEVLVDPLVHRLVDHVQRRGVRRLFIDGIESFAQTSTLGDRSNAICMALVQWLCASGVTTVISVESQLLATQLSSDTPWSAFFANAIVLRNVELRSELQRFIRIVKMRGSDFDSSSRQFAISSQGIVLSGRIANEDAPAPSGESPLGVRPPSEEGTP